MQDSIFELLQRFLGILYQALPYIIFGAIVAGLLEELVPQRFVARVLPRNRFVAIALSGLLGLIFPMCECGIVPVMRRLLRKGVPLSCCICYMLSGPIINVIVIVSTAVAFTDNETKTTGVAFTAEGTTRIEGPYLRQLGSVEMASFRVGLGFLVAVGTGLVVERALRKHGPEALLTPFAMPPAEEAAEEEIAAVRKPFFQRLNSITEVALHDFVDITVFLILGALLAATLGFLVKPDQIAAASQQYFPLAIFVMMLVAVALCLCSEADAFVAASFSTLPPSAKLGFLVLGPMLDFKLYLMYLRVFRPRLIWTIISTTVVQVYLYCFLSHFVIQYVLPLPSSPQAAPSAVAQDKP